MARGGFHDDEVVWPSSQASASRVQLFQQKKAQKASDEAARIYAAIVGAPASGNYGYLGDVGRYPASIMDLLSSPGLEGWNGPYLRGGVVPNDPWGHTYVYRAPGERANAQQQAAQDDRDDARLLESGR